MEDRAVASTTARATIEIIIRLRSRDTAGLLLSSVGAAPLSLSLMPKKEF